MLFRSPVTCIVLEWIGNRVFHHECLRRAAFEPHPLGPLRPLLLPGTPCPMNTLGGLLTPDIIRTFQDNHRIKLDDEQLNILEKINVSKSPLFCIKPLAGVGKTVVARAILFALLTSFEKTTTTDAVVLLLPSRELREDLVRELLLSLAKSNNEAVLWLGRPPSGLNRLGTPDTILTDRIRNLQHAAWTQLADLQKELQCGLASLTKYGEKRHAAWLYVEHRLFKNPSITWQGVPELLAEDSVVVGEYLDILHNVKTQLRKHIELEISGIANTYDSMLSVVAEPVRIVVSTADAWC